jgi:hypothetical protein
MELAKTEINSEEEANKVVCNFATSIDSVFRL